MVNNLLRIFPHILFNPIHHQPNKNIRIDAGNKILIFITNGYANAFFLDNTKNQIVNQWIQISLNLLVSLSMILYSERKEFSRREKAQRPHRPIIRFSLVRSELRTKIGKRIKSMRVIKPLLILSVAPLNLAVVPRSVGPNKLVPYPELLSGKLKSCR